MTRHSISAIAAIAMSVTFFACAEQVNAPDNMKPTLAAAALVSTSPEKLISGSAAYSVNEKGDAVGGGPGAPCGPGSLPRLWRADGSMLELPVGTHCGGNANVTSNSGYIVGVLYTPDAMALWTPNASGGYDLQELELVDGHRLNITGVNDAGEIVAHYGGKVYYRTPSSTSWIAVATPAGATSCKLGGINNSGAFVGSCFVNGAALTGYYWQNHDAAPTPLPRPATTNNVYANDINDAGVIVGFIGDCSILRALRWTLSAGVYNVAILPDPGRGASATAVSSNGTVTGDTYKGGSGTNYSATIWPTSGGYQVLPIIGKTFQDTEAKDVATTSAGTTIVVGRQATFAVRWK